MKASHSVVIAASPQQCFDAITDFRSYPEWQGPVRSVEVRAGDVVAFEVDAKVKTIRYTLRYSYEPPHRVTWDYVEGDAKSVDGDFVFEDLGDGTTRATYSLDIDPGRFVPGPVRKVLSDHVMKTSVEDLRRRLEG